MQWNSPEVVRNLLCFIANSSYCYVICSFFQKLFTQVGNSRHAARRALQSVPVRCSCWNNFAQSACFAGSICDPYRVQENSQEVTRFGSFRKAIRTSWDSPTRQEARASFRASEEFLWELLWVSTPERTDACCMVRADCDNEAALAL